MKRMAFITSTAATLALVAGMATAASDNKASVELGMLKCEQTDRTNLVVWSEATFTCSFDAVDSEQPEIYIGKINKIGVDLTLGKVETLTWAVMAPSDTTERGALEGSYVGASADVAVGTGASVRGLVGGFKDSFTLQPVAVSGQQGFGAAVGIEEFELEAVGS